MLDAVLLDWENVLVDTVDLRHDALRRALSEEKARPLESYGGASDAPAVLARIAAEDPTLADLVAVRAARAFAEQLGKGFVLRPGARELVERIQATSRLAIVTAATRSETEFVLRLAGLDAAASTIVSADDDVAPSPSPAAYQRALEQLARRRSVNAERTVAIVATVPTLRGARGASLRTVSLGLPAHAAVEADGALSQLTGVTIADLAAVAGVANAEHRA
jgi:beta-phosphoglucomutase-like phosphatase (HAD superfamily)